MNKTTIKRKLIEVITGIIYNTSKKKYRIVIDTNVILSSLKSNKGSSYRLVQMIDENLFDMCLSNAMVMEYESILSKQLDRKLYSDDNINAFLDYLCKSSINIRINYLWRPFLNDKYDDHVLELALNGEVNYIVTFNIKDFIKAEELGIKAITPKEFMKLIREEK